jgi:imidazolonepropionase
VARRSLAQFADADADPQSFSLEQIRRFLSAARAHGLGLRLHVPPTAHAGVIALAAELGATSVDGLEAATSAEMDLLARTSTIAVLLPGRTFHLGSGRFARARAFIEAGAAIALATNFNPGTSPSCSMPFALSLACTQMGMTPGEALAAATINGAHALGIAAEAGSLEHGKWADFVVLDASDYRELPYYFGMNLVAMTVRRGEVVYRREAC